MKLQPKGKKALEVGAVISAILGLTTVLTVTDVKQWLDLIQTYGSLISMILLVSALIFVSAKHQACQTDLHNLNQKILDIFGLVKATGDINGELSEEDFKTGHYDLETVIAALKKRHSHSKRVHRNGRKRIQK